MKLGADELLAACGLYELKNPALGLGLGLLLHIITLLLACLTVSAAIKAAVILSVWRFISFDWYLNFMIISEFWFAFLICVFFQLAHIGGPWLDRSERELGGLTAKLFRSRRSFFRAATLVIVSLPLFPLLLGLIDGLIIHPVEPAINLLEYKESAAYGASRLELMKNSLFMVIILTPLAYTLSGLFILPNQAFFVVFSLLNHHVWHLKSEAGVDEVRGGSA